MKSSLPMPRSKIAFHRILCFNRHDYKLRLSNNTNGLKNLTIHMATQFPHIELNRPTPFDQSYWVVADKLMAGYYPGYGDSEIVQRQLEGLLKYGIRHFISLMRPDEIKWFGQPILPYEDLAQAIARTLGCNVSFDRMPIKDMLIPTRFEMAKILDTLDTNIQAGKPIYLHCLGGVGRTGTVVGCYLTRHGYASGQKVLSLIQQLRQKTATHDRSSPESGPQIDLVLSWARGE